MRKSALFLLPLIGMLLLTACSPNSGTHTGNAAPPQPTKVFTPPPIPTPTQGPTAQCPRLPDAAGTAPAASPSLYTSPSGTSLAALNPSTGAVRWQDPFGANLQVTAALVADNVAYVSASSDGEDGILVALNASDGRLRWCIPLSPLISNSLGVQWDQLAVDGQTVYVTGDAAGSLRALNTSDGSERWHAFATGDIVGLTAANGRVYVT